VLSGSALARPGTGWISPDECMSKHSDGKCWTWPRLAAILRNWFVTFLLVFGARGVWCSGAAFFSARKPAAHSYARLSVSLAPLRRRWWGYARATSRRLGFRPRMEEGGGKAQFLSQTLFAGLSVRSSTSVENSLHFLFAVIQLGRRLFGCFSNATFGRLRRFEAAGLGGLAYGISFGGSRPPRSRSSQLLQAQKKPDWSLSHNGRKKKNCSARSSVHIVSG